MAVVDSIMARGRATPDKLAVLHNEQAFTYRAFAAHILAVRRFLEGRDIARDRIAILCTRHNLSTWIVGLALRSLGVDTANAISIEDVASLDCPGATVVSTAFEAHSWPGLEVAVVAAGHPFVLIPLDIYADVEAIEIDPAAPASWPGQGGHILRTSGTTGVYKKVLWDAAGIDALVALNAGPAGFSESTILNDMQFPGWTWSGYGWPNLAWVVGGQVLLSQDQPLWRPYEKRATVAFVTPGWLDHVLAAPAELDLRNDAMTLFLVAGVLSKAQWEAARERLTRRIVATYGATESCQLLYTPIETTEDLLWHRIDVAGTAEVVDEQDRPLPPGATGQVRLRTNFAGGYMDDPATTAAFFRHGYFYPGDLGVLSADSRLMLQGRITDVINVSGAKIASLPIETALQEALGALGVCVFSMPGLDGEVVHVAVQPGRPVNEGEVKAAVMAALPPATVRIHMLEVLPRNAIGKIQRTALRAQLLAHTPPSN